jgi:hypothetical protein
MAKPISDLIKEVVGQAKERQRPINEISKFWSGAAGKKIASRTRPAMLKKGALIVLSSDPGASFLLDIEKQNILKKLNSEISFKINEIVIRSGEI